MILFSPLQRALPRDYCLCYQGDVDEWLILRGWRLASFCQSKNSVHPELLLTAPYSIIECESWSSLCEICNFGVCSFVVSFFGKSQLRVILTCRAFTHYSHLNTRIMIKSTCHLYWYFKNPWRCSLRFKSHSVLSNSVNCSSQSSVCSMFAL